MRHPLHLHGYLAFRAGRNLVHNFGIETAGYLTFLWLLSLFPYLLLIVSAAGVVGQGEAGRQFIEMMLQHLPAEGVKTLRPRIIEIISGPPQGLLTFAILSALWTSSSAIEAIRGVLNRAYRVGKPPAYLSRRIMAILQVIAFTLVFLAVIILLVLIPILVNFFTDLTGIAVPLELQAFVNEYFLYVGAVAMFLIVASMYYVLPNLKQTWRKVVPGALLVVVLWAAAAKLVSFYLTEITQLTPVYGSLSGFIATLIFFYVMILIFIYGAEYNHELVIMRGEAIVEQEPSVCPPDGQKQA